MIVTEKQARYHASYLKTLRPIKGGHANEVLNDGHHRVLFVRAFNNVLVQGRQGDGNEWKIAAGYEAETGPLYCQPWTSGLSSQPSAIARYLTALITAMEPINRNNVRGIIEDDCREFTYKLRCRLISEGWRIRATATGWKVLQPLTGKRNDNHECDGVT